MIYENIKKTWNESIFNLGLLEENMHFIIYTAVCFLAPFLLGHPQILVGVLVNASLILGATYLKSYKLLPIILLPSIAVLSRGLIFGPFTVFLIYMIPFIWVGNAIYAYIYRYLHAKKNNYLLSIGAASILKTIFLFGTAFALVKLSVLPAIFLTTMGILQLGTAVAGGILAMATIQIRKVIMKEN
jgi:hypothetical protein